MNRHRFACLLLILATLLVYLPVQRFEFLFLDDPEYVVHNPVVQSGLTWSGIQWAFTTNHAGNWHPLTWLSHMLDCQVFGPDAGAPHLINALIHAVNAGLVFLLLARLTGSFWPAVFAAALFAWHPLRIESVAWVAERKDVLSSFFGLLTLLSYVRFGQQRESRAYWLALLFFGLGLLAKPMLVTLPFILLLLDFWPLNRRATSPSSRLVLEKCPFFLLSAASCVLTFIAQRNVAVLALEVFPLPARLANAVNSYAGYLWKMVWPTHLAVFYPLNVQTHWTAIAAAAALLAAFSWLTWRSRRTKPYLLLGWLWYLGTLVPVIGLVQVGNQSMADRYTYLPMVGIVIAIAYGLRDLMAQGRFGTRATATVGGLVLAGCLLTTHRQLSYWHDNVSLFSHAIAVTRNNTLAHIILGTALSKQGHPVEAEENYREALRIEPLNGLAHQNLASLLDDTDRAEEALAEYAVALQLRPNVPAVYLAYGKRLAQTGRVDEAMQQFARAAQLTPRAAEPYFLMGMTRMRQGRGMESVVHFHKTLRLDSNHVPALTYLARLLATHNDAGVRNAEEALFMAQRANGLSGGQKPFILDTLAAAYAEGGHFPEAETNVLQAISLTTADTNAIPAMKERLKHYQNHQPWREAATNAPLELEP